MSHVLVVFCRRLALILAIRVSYRFVGGSDLIDYQQSQILNPGEQPPFDPLDYENDIRVAGETDVDYRNGLRDARALWHQRYIPYELNPQLTDKARQAVMDAIHDYKKYTCIRFIPRDVKKHRDFVEFIRDKGCYSYVGRNGGRQTLSLGDGCEVKGIAIHEMMHVAGFMHEQSRSDRDTFVSVLYQNIPRKLWDQFDKMKGRQENNLGTKYDFNSVMHYSRKAFSANGRDTIIPKIDGINIGQRRGFSTIDVFKINELYGCPQPTFNFTVTTPPTVEESAEVTTTNDPATTDSDKENKGVSEEVGTEEEQGEEDEEATVIEGYTGNPDVDKGNAGECKNRKNELYCEMKRKTGWCRKSRQIALEHCPVTCGVCPHKSVGRTPDLSAVASKTTTFPVSSVERGLTTEDSLVPGLTVDFTEPPPGNYSCAPSSRNADILCCDNWENCFDFHCVLYATYCQKTCKICD